MVCVRTETCTDPAQPGDGKTHCGMTSVLQAAGDPALELAWAYHERWEIARASAAIDTPPRLLRPPVRCQQPVGVIQER